MIDADAAQALERNRVAQGGALQVREAALDQGSGSDPAGSAPVGRRIQ